MDIQTIIAACCVLLIAVVCVILSVRHFQQKGLLLNNAYLFASPQEKERMNKQPYYRQSAVIFLLLGLAFGSLAAHLFTGLVFWRGFSYGGIIVTAVFAVISAIHIGRDHR